MKIDITQPQPCPNPKCGNHLRIRYANPDFTSPTVFWCECVHCYYTSPVVQSRHEAVKSHNRLSLLARLGEVEEAKESADWAYFKKGNDGPEMVYARCGLGDEHRAILAALEELEETKCLS